MSTNVHESSGLGELSILNPATSSPSVLQPDGRGLDYRCLARARSGPVTFLDSQGVTGELQRHVLFEAALSAAAGLGHHGVRATDRVVISAATSPEYLTMLVACLLAGVVPCTVAPPPRPDDPTSAGVAHLNAAVDAVTPRAVIVSDSALVPAIDRGTTLLIIDDLWDHGRLDADGLPSPQPHDAHHIQLTSGSTSAPKAVVLTHASVAAQLAVLADAAQSRPGQDGIFTWLPLYHDMGLVQVLLALIHEIELDLMPPVAFLRDPVSWIRHMARRGRSFTAGPPFAYRTVLDRYLARPEPDLDLSCLRQAYVGAEPISVPVLQQFQETFAPLGLNQNVLIPCYGMAETVLAASIAAPGPTTDTSFGRVRWRDFDRAALDEQRLAVPASPGRVSRRIASCGSPVRGLQVRLLDEDGAEVAPDRVGAIHLRGPLVMSGYLTPGGLDAPVDGWHDTGDLGLLHDGELYVVGRTKEMLIVRGRNLPPYDIEDLLERHPQVTAGACAVFSVTDDAKGTEQIVAVVETRADPAAWRQIRQELELTVRQTFSLTLTDVVAVPRGGIPRTTSGKRQRSALRRQYLNGALR